MAAAARVSDNHTCPKSDGNKPHVGGPIFMTGPSNVYIGGQPAAYKGMSCQCVSPDIDSVKQGSGSVNINGQPAARQGDPTMHGGLIATGLNTVNIGG